MTSPFADLYSGKRVLVTGHTGFKGSWLALWLHHLGADVTGYSDEVPASPSVFEFLGLETQIGHRLGDVRDRGRLAEVLDEVRPDMIFHLAAQALVLQSHLDPVEPSRPTRWAWSTCSNASANGPGSRLPCS